MTNQIQLYQSVKDTTGSITTVDEIINIIHGKAPGSSNIEKRIVSVRNFKQAIEILQSKTAEEKAAMPDWDKYLKDRQAEYERQKQGLPAVCWSGTFKKRSAKELIDYSQLICIDIDKIGTTASQVQEVKNQLMADQYSFIVFISPSGNGIKVIIKVAGTAADHKETFIAIEQYYKKELGITIDPSGKDVSRLCFLSIDKNIAVNDKAATFILPATKPLTEPEKKKLSSLTPDEKKNLQTTGQAVNDIWESTQQVISYSEGNRNNFIFKFACNCNRVGISQADCSSFATSAAHDLKAKQVDDTIKSAYNHNSHEHGKFKKKEAQPGSSAKGMDNSNKKSRKGNENTNGSTTEGQPDFKFWKEHKTIRGKKPNTYEEIRYELSRVDFCDFLFKKGFHLLPTGDEEGFQIVHSQDGIIKPISPQQMKHFSLDWCKQNYLKEVEEMLRKGQTKYFAKNELDSLPFKEVVLKRDTSEETFFYFRNCFIAVDKKGNINELPYSSVDNYIWESNKIKFDYVDTKLEILNDKDQLLPYENINCEFAKFVALASYNPNNEEEKHFTRAQITQRFFSFCSAIGFLLDGYKHPSERKAVFAIDHAIGERNEANGRTGKSMIPQACEKLKRVANISGKNYDPKYQFCDEPITVDTQIINFNDMQRNFDVENIFEKIADPYSVNRRNQGFIHFKYINSPKIYYSTNFIPKGEGQSYKARMNVIEFSDYFNSSHTPYDEFGHGFFDDSWDNDEWQRFYNFMIWCVAFNKEYGLTPYPLPNIEARKLINDVVPEFIDYMEDANEVPKNVRLEKIKLQEKFNERYMQLYNKKLTAHTFTSWLKKFCTTKGHQLNPKQNGKHDKSNSIEYVTIADENYKSEQLNLL
jgi:hypothetical protein